MPLDNVVFWVFAPIAVASAIGMLFMRNAVHAALFLIVDFMCISVMYLLLDAPFLFAVQIIVYAGAIMVLFLFVIMLLGVDRHEDLRERLRGQRIAGLALAAGAALEIGLAVRAGIGFSRHVPPSTLSGTAEALAKPLFTTYFFPFEVTSVLLIVAAIAAMVLAQRKAKAVTLAEANARNAERDARLRDATK
ncbi:MAG: NADH-quinone oxidoreductase subunit [Actinomycetota bacterium]|nr:NADH-quinone oxidoreductase subunit [Actinomycetota bacterium]